MYAKPSVTFRKYTFCKSTWIELTSLFFRDANRKPSFELGVHEKETGRGKPVTLKSENLPSSRQGRRVGKNPLRGRVHCNRTLYLELGVHGEKKVAQKYVTLKSENFPFALGMEEVWRSTLSEGGNIATEGFLSSRASARKKIVEVQSETISPPKGKCAL